MYKLLKFDYARDSFGYLLEKFKIKEIYLPYYLCDVIRHKAYSLDVKIQYYHIDDSFMPENDFPEEAFILYPNYFGICDKNVDKLEKQYKNLIVDNAHSFYSPAQGFACFNSERKFRNVESGSYLMIKTDEQKENFVINDNSVCKKRKDAFIKWNKKYGSLNQLNIDEENSRSPFCYPILCNTDKLADDIATELGNKGLIIYRYWNNLPKNFNEYKFYRRLVPVPIN